MAEGDFMLMASYLISSAVLDTAYGRLCPWWRAYRAAAITVAAITLDLILTPSAWGRAGARPCTDRHTPGQEKFGPPTQRGVRGKL